MPVPGEAFGRYRVVGRHRFHAAGYVIDARDERTDALRELWLLTPAVVTDAALRADLVRSATAVRKVRAEGLVPLDEFGEVDGQPFFARSRPEGVPLASLAPGTLAAVDALEVIAQIGQALHALHDAGLVDGALGPGRIVVAGGAGHVRARLRDGAVLGVLVAANAVVGPVWEETLDYRAPEVHAGRPADARADIYALGGLLWTALTGRTPFATYVGHQLDPVPQLAGDGRAVAALNHVLWRALAKEPAVRFSSIRDMVDAIRLVPALAELRVEVADRAVPVAAAPRGPAGHAGPDPVVPAPEEVQPADGVPAADRVHADDPVTAVDGETPDDDAAPPAEAVLRTALPDDPGRPEAAVARGDGSGPSLVLVAVVMLLGLLLALAVVAVRHFDLVALPGGEAGDPASMAVRGPQIAGPRAIA